MTEPKPAGETPGGELDGAERGGLASTDLSPPVSAASERQGPSLGKCLKIRSMVTVAGEVLPFFWPMRNFIHHNPLHGLEHLPFEQAIDEATRLFHARGWLPRRDYQQMLADGDIAREDIAAEVDAFVADWLEHEGAGDGAGEGGGANGGADADLARLLRETLLAMMTATSQPVPGDRVPCAEDVLDCLREGAGIAEPGLSEARRGRR